MLVDEHAILANNSRDLKLRFYIYMADSMYFEVRRHNHSLIPVKKYSVRTFSKRQVVTIHFLTGYKTAIGLRRYARPRAAVRYLMHASMY